MLVPLLAAAVLSQTPAPPSPDPYPSPIVDGWQQVVSVTYVSYTYDLPAVNADTGKVIPGVYFHCTVPVKWKGKPNRWGHAVCVLRKR